MKKTGKTTNIEADYLYMYEKIKTIKCIVGYLSI